MQYLRNSRYQYSFNSRYQYCRRVLSSEESYSSYTLNSTVKVTFNLTIDVLTSRVLRSYSSYTWNSTVEVTFNLASDVLTSWVLLSYSSYTLNGPLQANGLWQDTNVASAWEVTFNWPVMFLPQESCWLVAFSFRSSCFICLSLKDFSWFKTFQRILCMLLLLISFKNKCLDVFIV